MAESNCGKDEIISVNNKSRHDIANSTMSSEDSKRDKYIVDRADHENSVSLDSSNGNSLTENEILKSDFERTDEKEANSVLNPNNNVVNGINAEYDGDSSLVENGNISLNIVEIEEKGVILVDNQDNSNSIKLNGDSAALNNKGNEGKYETDRNMDEEKREVELETDDNSTVNLNGCSLLSDEDTNPKFATKLEQDEGLNAVLSSENSYIKESVVNGGTADVPTDSSTATPDEAPKPISEEEPVKIKSWKDVAVSGMKSVPHKAQFRSAKPMVSRYVPKIGKNIISANKLKKSEAEFDESVADSMENKSENEVRVSESVSNHVEEESKNESGDSETVETAVHSANTNKEEEANTHEGASRRVYKVRVPKFAYEERKKEISNAKYVLDEKNKIRDCIYEEKLQQDVKRKKCKLDYDAEKLKENNARAELCAKSKELDSVQKFVSPMLIADIDNEIEELTIRQQYERMPLNKQKEIMRKMEQLEQQKRNIISNQGPQPQSDVSKQKEEHEKQFKELKKDVGALKALLLKAENNSKSAWDKYVNEDKIFSNFREKHNAANVERKEAYLHWMELKTQIDEKARCFDFREERKAIDEFKFAGDIQGLVFYCNNQVEKFFERYNNDTEFRNEYVKANFDRTIKRLGSLDGRSLGPNEKSHILGLAEKSSPNAGIPTTVSSIEPKVESSAAAKVNTGALKKQEKGNKLEKEEEEKARKEEETRKAKEAEEENIRKEEEAKKEMLRKEREAAELREKIIAEEKEKMIKAEERKKKKEAAKAQKRAEYKAQKEAEEREKKKAKEHKKQCDTPNTPSVSTEGSTSSPEKKLPDASQEPETSKSEVLKEKNKSVASRRPKKKHSIPKDPLPLPPTLRNKRKRTMKWMWSMVVVLVALVLFVAGNYISFEASWLSSFDL